jgi:hypothetical protein
VSERQLVAHLEKLDPASSKASRQHDFGHETYEAAIELFTKQHYLTREKEDDLNGGEDRVNVLGLGPRAFLEVGRRQVLFFTHEAVGMSVDQALLDELKDDEEDGGEEEAEGGEA